MNENKLGFLILAVACMLSLAAMAAMSAGAVVKIDPAIKGSITLKKTVAPDSGNHGTGQAETFDNTPLANVDFMLTRVATNDGTYGARQLALNALADGAVLEYAWGTLSGGGSITQRSDTNGVLSFSNLPIGIYLVTELPNVAVATSAAPFYVQIPTTNPDGKTLNYDVFAYPKNILSSNNDVQFYKQVVGGDENNFLTVNNGADVQWLVATQIPADLGTTANGGAANDFVITDTFDSHLEDPKVESVVLWDGTVAGDELNKGTDYTVVTTGQEVVITVNKVGRDKLASAKVDVDSPMTHFRVLYTSNLVLTEAELLAQYTATNNATYAYTNVVGTKRDGDTTDDPIYGDDGDEPTVTSCGFMFTKTGEGAEATALAGAKFVLSANSDGSGTPVGAEVTTGEDGTAVFSEGIAAGTYYLVETEAPSGYNLLSKPFKVTVDEDSVSVSSASVANHKGFFFPLTGGAGIALFVLLGSVCIAASLVLAKQRPTQLT